MLWITDHMIVLCVMKVTVSDLAIQVEHIFSWETGKATKVRPLANHCLHPYVSSWGQEECHRGKKSNMLDFSVFDYVTPQEHSTQIQHDSKSC